MNLNEYRNLMLTFSTITLHPRKQNWNFFTFIINGNQTFIFQMYKVARPLGEKLDFFSPLGFEDKSDFGHKTSKLKPT